MTAPFAMPAGVGGSPSGPADTTKQAPKPAAPKLPQAPAPLAMGGNAMAGGNTQQQAAVPIPQTADPLAFAPNATITPQTGGTMMNTQTANPDAATAVVQPPTMTPEQWQNYSPLAGKSEEEKKLYWAGQGTQGLSGLPGYAPGKGGAYDPASNAAATNAYKNTNAGAIADITKQVQGGQAGALTATNAGQAVVNRDRATQDATGNITSLQAGGTFTPEGEAAERAQLMKEAGFGADGAYTPETEAHPMANNPNATPGFPTNYDPNKPNLDPSGAVDPVQAITQATTGGGGNNVSMSEINPSDSLLSKVINPGQNIDRVKTFQDALNSTRTNVLDPAREAEAKTLNRYNFGAGRGVSGEARTSQGDLADRYDARLADMSAQGIADATRGSIDDNYRNIDETQQERGYQADRADTAFNQDTDLAQLNEMLTNGAFGRAERQQNAGYKDSPEDIGLILSKIFGDQSSAAGRAAAESFKNAGSGGGGGSTADIMKIIEAYRKSQAGGGAPAGGGDAYPDN